jgi:hypothetical protein
MGLETIKILGGLAGLVSAGFLVWDRWARGRPLAWVTARKFGASRYSYIRIQNPGPADLFIRKVRAYPPIYGFAKDHWLDSIAAATVDADVHVLLAAGETHEVVLVPKETSETSDVPRNPETSDVPRIPETSDVPRDPETPNVPGDPETPGVPRDPETSDVPRDPETPARPRRVSFYIHWRKTSSSWLWQIPVTVRSSTCDIEQIAAATTKPFQVP